MVIIIAFGLLFALFFLIRKHIGPAHLATIAGLSVYEMFGRDFVSFLERNIQGSSAELIDSLVYLALILVFPMILYLHSARGGLFGVLRIAEAAVFAALLTSMVAGVLVKIFSFDQIANDFLGFINQVKGPILMGGILAAYLDIIFYRE